MGDVYWGLHIPLANRLGRCLRLNAAVETGTYFAGGSIQLATFFKKVWTIENDPELFDFVSSEYESIAHLHFLQGASPEILNMLLPTIDEPALFVLDAHWFPGAGPSPTEGRTQCPLMDELNAIEAKFRHLSRSAIMIDDADMFLDALGRRFRESDFPPLLSVINKLKNIFQNGVVEIIDDVIVAGPIDISETIHSYRKIKHQIGTPRQ